MNVLKHKVDKDFTIVSNVLLKSKLSAKAKGIFVQLISLPEGWNFSVAGLSALFTDKGTSIKSGIAELVDSGFLIWDSVRDEHGKFSVNVTTQYPKTPHGKTSTGENPARENKDNKEGRDKEGNLNKESNNNSTNVELAKAKKQIDKKEEYGNQEINNLFDKWNKATGYAINSRIQSNRRACWNLYRKHGQGGLETLLRGVAMAQQDQYAPRISDFVDLQAKLNQLSLWIKKGAPTPASTTNTSSSPNKIANINSKISEYLADKFPGNTPIPVNEIYKARSLFI